MAPENHTNSKYLKVYQIGDTGDLKFEFPAHFSSEITIKLFSAAGELLYFLKDFEIRQKGNSIIIGLQEIRLQKLNILKYEVLAQGLVYTGKLKLSRN